MIYDSCMSRRVCVQILMYNCDRFILHTIANCANFVDKIYVSYSAKPWKYNIKSRSVLSNNSDIKILDSSPFRDKIEVICGDWLYEEDQRNECLKKARYDGYDFMIMQDADEFLHHEDYKKIIKQMIDNNNFNVFHIPMVAFWKNIKFVLVGSNKKPVYETARFAINCNKDSVFIDKRFPSNDENSFSLKGTLFHLSYVLADDELKSKLATWGHAQDFDVHNWYLKKWLCWHPGVRNLHPVVPKLWHHAEEHNLSLPVEAVHASQGLVPTIAEQRSFFSKIFSLFGTGY
jgi:hypothetical protein